MRPPSASTPRRPDAGLTLVELMITIIIASLVASSTFIFFSGQQRIYETQTKVLNTQQNVTAALEMMARYVRAEGTGLLGCVRPDPDGVGVGTDNGDPGPVGAGTAFNQAPQTGLRAYLTGVGAIRIPPVWIVNGASGAPDSIAVAFGNGTFGNWSDTMDATFAAAIGTTNVTDPISNVTVPLAPANQIAIFRDKDFMVLLDPRQVTTLSQVPIPPAVAVPPNNMDRGCTMFQVNGVPAAGILPHPAAGSIWNPPSAASAVGMVPFTYTAGTFTGIRNIGTLTWIRFAIQPAVAQTGGKPPRPPFLTMERLDMNGVAGYGPQKLAEGIEDLQVAYACDTNNDGNLTENNPPDATDEWILNATADSAALPTNCNRPSAIRLNLIARSATEDSLLNGLQSGGSPNAKPAVEDGAAGTADSYRRRVLTTTVFPRNY
jgi:prepilin-type N-terminal cleavage/methylation domain-containing protein